MSYKAIDYFHQTTVHEESTLKLEMTGFHLTKFYKEENIQIKRHSPSRYHFTSVHCDVTMRPLNELEGSIKLTRDGCRLVDDYYFTAKSDNLKDLKEGMKKV